MEIQNKIRTYMKLNERLQISESKTTLFEGNDKMRFHD